MIAGHSKEQSHDVGSIFLNPDIKYGLDGFVELHLLVDPDAMQLGISRNGCGVSEMKMRLLELPRS
jgi:hypothetical protein